MRCLCPLLLLVAVEVLAGERTDGYMRQGTLAPLRFAKAPPPPAAVDRSIVNLDDPPKPVASKPVEPVKDMGSDAAGLPDDLKEMIEDLIRKPARSRHELTVDTDNPDPATTPKAGPTGDTIPTVPGVTSVPPENSQVEAAQDLSQILAMFKTNASRRTRDTTPVVIVPPTFLPPQPSSTGPSSRAVYRSP